MKSSMAARLVLVTAPDARTARNLIKSALGKRLAACANIIPHLESHYWWKHKVEHSPESLILFKTSKSLLRELSALITAEHPYDTPEFVSISVDHVEKRYLDWWSLNLAKPSQKKKRLTDKA